ncbi:hypothetical protein D3C79_729310 [compost metagenome]
MLGENAVQRALGGAHFTGDHIRGELEVGKAVFDAAFGSFEIGLLMLLLKGQGQAFGTTQGRPYQADQRVHHGLQVGRAIHIVEELAGNEAGNAADACARGDFPVEDQPAAVRHTLQFVSRDHQGNLL